MMCLASPVCTAIQSLVMKYDDFTISRQFDIKLDNICARLNRRLYGGNSVLDKCMRGWVDTLRRACCIRQALTVIGLVHTPMGEKAHFAFGNTRNP